MTKIFFGATKGKILTEMWTQIYN